jgi:hypothetical protein
MQLDKQLILFRYILRQFGYQAFEDLRNDYNGQTFSITTTGYTSFAARLIMNP